MKKKLLLDKKEEEEDGLGVLFSAYFPKGEKTHRVIAFEQLLEDLTKDKLEPFAQRAQQLSWQHFGRTMRLFAPLYLSNECVNNCTYCGFSRDNPIVRSTLTLEQVNEEARYIHALGHRNLLLVAGEHPRFVSEGYLQESVRMLKGLFPTIGIEVGPMQTHQYSEVVAAGAEGLVVYQETYDEGIYKKLHTSGPKKKFAWRLDCPQRAYEGGFRRIGIGALFGLAPWKREALSLASHLDYLLKHCWKASYTVSFPRMRPYAGNYQYTPNPDLFLNDVDFVRLLIAFRIIFPQVGIVVSTREPAHFRNAITPLGVTHMSAEAKTEPGGYTGAGQPDLHLTCKGKRIELDEGSKRGLVTSACQTLKATEQFQISDTRTTQEVINDLEHLGYQPVWKDWDMHILSAS